MCYEAKEQLRFLFSECYFPYYFHVFSSYYQFLCVISHHCPHIFNLWGRRKWGKKGLVLILWLTALLFFKVIFAGRSNAQCREMWCYELTVCGYHEALEGEKDTLPKAEVKQSWKCVLMPVLWLISVNATFTLHLHGVVTKLLVQVVGSAGPRFACWQSHLDAGCFGTLCLASRRSREETQWVTYEIRAKSLPWYYNGHYRGRRAYKVFLDFIWNFVHILQPLQHELWLFLAIPNFSFLIITS